MKTLLENVLGKKFEISKNFKIKQDQRNKLKADIEIALLDVFNDLGIECKMVDKAIAIKLDNLETRTPNGYIPVKVSVAIPSVDFDIDFESDYLIAEKKRKIEEKELEKIKKAKKIERDKENRRLLKEQKQKTIEKGAK